MSTPIYTLEINNASYENGTGVNFATIFGNKAERNAVLSDITSTRCIKIAKGSLYICKDSELDVYSLQDDNT